jgi:mannitol 2-dehydrogenase
VVERVEPYELMKLRLLNAGHSALGYLGHLAGYTYIHEVVADPQFRAFVQRLMREEVVPLLPCIPGIDLDEYCRTLLVRFGNTAIRDLVSRICLNGSAKMPKFILASIRDHIQTQEKAHQTVTAPPLLTLCVAGWFRYLTGVDESGHSYGIEDTMGKELQQLATEGGADPTALLSVHCMFCGHVAGTPTFVAELTTALGMLYSRGVRATMAHYVRVE